MKKLIEYYSNNSGGSDWLSDQDWYNLADAGWRLYGFDSFIFKNGTTQYDTDGYPANTNKSVRFKYAYKFFESIEEAIDEWEQIVNQDPEEEGCPCCGQPHNFSAINRLID